jgi:PAS domain S-box-containing protein
VARHPLSRAQLQERSTAGGSRGCGAPGRPAPVGIGPAPPQSLSPTPPMEQSRLVETRLRAAVDSAPAGILMVDADGRIVLVNREIERLFGYAREELLGRSVELLVPERFRGAHPTQRAGYLADPRVRAMGVGRDLYGRRSDGREVPIEIGLTPVATEEGLFVLSSVVDLSARRRAEERFRIAVESSPNGMVMIDARGSILLVNREIERLFAYPRGELLGQPIEMLVPERFRESHPALRRAYAEAPEIRGMGTGRDLFGLRRDGSEFPVEIGLNPIEADGQLLVLAAVVDISSRQEAERDRQRLERDLRQAQKLQAVGTLAGGFAHDFNNLLAAILGYTEMARAAVLEGSKIAGDLDEVLRAVDRGRQLVLRILQFSRRQESVRRPMELGPVLDEAAHLLRASLPPSIEVTLRVDPAAPRILGDGTSMHQVLMNLATNAAHAMPHGGRVDIRVESTYLRDSFVRSHPELREGPYCLLSVADTGCGMDAELLERALEPFFTTKAPGSGSGLGLSMVHAIVQEHEGLVQLESEVGRGTTVRCYFPGIENGDVEPGDQAPTIPRGRGQRILYVDDEVTLALLGGRRLESLGYRVEVTSDPQQALQRMGSAEPPFELVITDHLMPQCTGIELAAAITARHPALPVLLVTGYVEELPAEQMRAAGIRQVVGKPVSTAQLAQAVHALLSPP